MDYFSYQENVMSITLLKEMGTSETYSGTSMNFISQHSERDDMPIIMQCVFLFLYHDSILADNTVEVPWIWVITENVSKLLH